MRESSKTALIPPTKGGGNIFQMQSPLIAFNFGIWIGRTQSLCNIPVAALSCTEGHRKVVRRLRKGEVMGAINGVINSYSGKLSVISLGPLCLYYIGDVSFWDAAHQSHISTRQSTDQFSLCNDIFRLALKKQTGPFSEQVMFKQSFIQSHL